MKLDQYGNAIVVLQQYEKDDSGNGNVISLFARRHDQSNGWGNIDLQTNLLTDPPVCLENYNQPKRLVYTVVIDFDLIGNAILVWIPNITGTSFSLFAKHFK